MTSADQPVVYLTHEEYAALLAERDRLREAITWASVITSHGMGLSTSEERTLHSVLTSALKGDQT